MAYWEERIRLRMATYDRAANQVMAQITNAYNAAYAQLDMDVEQIIGKFEHMFQLNRTEAMAFLRQPAPMDILDTLRARLPFITDARERNLLNARINSPAYAARISRLDALKESARVSMTKASDAQLRATTGHLQGIAGEAFGRTMFDIQKASFGFSFTGMSEQRIAQIMRNNWSGMHYSGRVWSNRDAAAQTLQQGLVEALTTGKTSAQTFQELRRQVQAVSKNGKDMSQYAANRLLRTETSYIVNQSEMDAYQEAGVEKYEIVSILDSRTSEKCQGLDGKVFLTKDAKPGINYPPFHAFCRTHHQPRMDGLEVDGTRVAVDKNGNEMKIPRTMTYKKWAEWQAAGMPPF